MTIKDIEARKLKAGDAVVHRNGKLFVVTVHKSDFNQEFWVEGINLDHDGNEAVAEVIFDSAQIVAVDR